MSFTSEVQRPVSNLSDAEKQVLLGSLLQIIYHLHKAGIIGVQRMCLSCSFHKEGHRGHWHYCTLLNKPLTVATMRLDCPEYEKIPA